MSLVRKARNKGGGGVDIIILGSTGCSTLELVLLVVVGAVLLNNKSIEYELYRHHSSTRRRATTVPSPLLRLVVKVGV
jgi:hypothetical protein